MASIRNLKKDINFLASELIAQAYLNKLFFKSIGDEELSKMVSDALDFRETFVSRANRPDGKNNPALVKSHYRTLRKDMVERFGELFESVNSNIEEKAG